VRTRDTIDLSSDKLFESPFYNLLQNDVVLVEASKAKTKSAEQAAIAQKVSFALAIVTSAATIASIFIRN
jgi:polysaccharide export outer membrane protein